MNGRSQGCRCRYLLLENSGLSSNGRHYAKLIQLNFNAIQI